MAVAESVQQSIRTLYVLMADVLEDAVEAQARGNVDEGAVLSEQASVLGSRR